MSTVRGRRAATRAGRRADAQFRRRPLFLHRPLSRSISSRCIARTAASLRPVICCARPWPRFRNFSEAAGPVRTSPFARSLSTHFVRLAVIDDPAFHGRVSGDAIRQAIKGVDLLAHQPVDHLSRAWLLLAADFDAPDESDAARDSWADVLWTQMEPELRAIFRHCHGFDRVDGPEAFSAYLAKGQIDTTMSFNDYWIDPMDVRALPLGRVGLVILLLVRPLPRRWHGGSTAEYGGGWLLWVGLGLVGARRRRLDGLSADHAPRRAALPDGARQRSQVGPQGPLPSARADPLRDRASGRRRRRRCTTRSASSWRDHDPATSTARPSLRECCGHERHRLPGRHRIRRRPGQHPDRLWPARLPAWPLRPAQRAPSRGRPRLRRGAASPRHHRGALAVAAQGRCRRVGSRSSGPR